MSRLCNETTNQCTNTILWFQLKSQVKERSLCHSLCPRKLWPVCGYREGAVYSVISDFTQLHRSSFNLEFEIFFEHSMVWVNLI